jgi:hypothetical protein
VRKQFQDRVIDYRTFEESIKIWNFIFSINVELEDLARRKDVPFTLELGYTNMMKIRAFDAVYPGYTTTHSDSQKLSVMQNLVS